MLVEKRERDRLIAEITQFESEFRQATITVKSRCGRVTIECNHRGELLGIDISDEFPREVGIEEAEQLLIDTVNSAIEAPEKARERFYGELRICGETIATWEKHPPPPHSSQALAVGFVNILRAGMPLRLELNEGADDVRS